MDASSVVEETCDGELVGFLFLAERTPLCAVYKFALSHGLRVYADAVRQTLLLSEKSLKWRDA